MTLAKIEEWKILSAPDPAALQKRIDDNVGSALSLGDLVRIKVPSSGATSWEVVDQLTGEVNPIKSIQGIVVLWQMQRAYWKVAYGTPGQQGDNSPDCSSVDAQTGQGDPGGDCLQCPLSKFGTATNKDGTAGAGQACTQMMTVFIVRPKSYLPIILRVPPSSLQNMRRFFVGITESDLHYRDVVVEFGLEKADNAGGLEYSRIRPRMMSMIPPEKRENIHSYGERLRPMLIQTARND